MQIIVYNEINILLLYRKRIKRILNSSFLENLVFQHFPCSLYNFRLELDPLLHQPVNDARGHQFQILSRELLRDHPTQEAVAPLSEDALLLSVVYELVREGEEVPVHLRVFNSFLQLGARNRALLQQVAQDRGGQDTPLQHAYILTEDCAQLQYRLLASHRDRLRVQHAVQHPERASDNQPAVIHALNGPEQGLHLVVQRAHDVRPEFRLEDEEEVENSFKFPVVAGDEVLDGIRYREEERVQQTVLEHAQRRTHGSERLRGVNNQVRVEALGGHDTALDGSGQVQCELRTERVLGVEPNHFAQVFGVQMHVLWNTRGAVIESLEIFQLPSGQNQLR
ncbi:Hypothetical_protein [Hexamita inflata]|uniref:Hypothetical_protein n=1 Tax=Hexamita inflata TaxID=28002 RepID=A0ABP1HXV7_9EUKA